VSRRGFAGAVGFTVAAVGVFVALDHYGGTERFADLPGGADVRLAGRFTPRQIERLAALPQAAEAECDATLYDVGVTTVRLTLVQATVLTAVHSPGLQRAALVEGRSPATDTELLGVQERGLHIGERVTLTRGGHSLAATVTGLAARPAGEPGAVALLRSGAISRLDGGAPCDEVAVRLRRRSEATAFQRAARDVLGDEPAVTYAVTYDESLRGHV
jgi:hypothetical protein